MDRMRYANVSEALWQGHGWWPACRAPCPTLRQRRLSTLEFHAAWRRADAR